MRAVSAGPSSTWPTGRAIPKSPRRPAVRSLSTTRSPGTAFAGHPTQPTRNHSMSLLNQILTGLAGNALGRPNLPQSSGGGSGGVIAALLPVVLGMLANRQGGMGGGLFPGSAGTGGGLGGAGGLGGLLEQFTQRGYGRQASSWVGTGPNEPLPPEALSDVFGQQQLADIASQAGVSEDEARTGLSQLLPEVVDHFTPGGQLGPQEQLLASIDDFARQMPR
jgi:uncharacterized protein YidB (DUF937 family)